MDYLKQKLNELWKFDFDLLSRVIFVNYNCQHVSIALVIVKKPLLVKWPFLKSNKNQIQDFNQAEWGQANKTLV